MTLAALLISKIVPTSSFYIAGCLLYHVEAVAIDTFNGRIYNAFLKYLFVACDKISASSSELFMLIF